jgi:hypothetical protein
MSQDQPLTIEILGLGPGGPVIVDRVRGGSAYLDEAKRIGERLLSCSDIGGGPGGYRILTADLELLYSWPSGDDGELKTPPAIHSR